MAGGERRRSLGLMTITRKPRDDGGILMIDLNFGSGLKRSEGGEQGSWLKPRSFFREGVWLRSRGWGALLLAAGCLSCACATPDPRGAEFGAPFASRSPIDFERGASGGIVVMPENLAEVDIQTVVEICNVVWNGESQDPVDYSRLAEAFAASLEREDYRDAREQYELAKRCIRNARGSSHLEAMKVGLAHLDYAKRALDRIEAALEDDPSD